MQDFKGEFQRFAGPSGGKVSVAAPGFEWEFQLFPGVCLPRSMQGFQEDFKRLAGPTGEAILPECLGIDYGVEDYAQNGLVTRDRQEVNDFFKKFVKFQPFFL